MEQFEYLGDESQVAMQQRFYRLWPYLQTNPQMSFGGRTIGIDDPQIEDALKIAGLIKELGFLPLMFVQASIVEPLSSILEEEEWRWDDGAISFPASKVKRNAAPCSIPAGFRTATE